MKDHGNKDRQDHGRVWGQSRNRSAAGGKASGNGEVFRRRVSVRERGKRFGGFCQRVTGKAYVAARPERLTYSAGYVRIQGDRKPGETKDRGPRGGAKDEARTGHPTVDVYKRPFRERKDEQ